MEISAERPLPCPIIAVAERLGSALWRGRERAGGPLDGFGTVQALKRFRTRLQPILVRIRDNRPSEAAHGLSGSRDRSGGTPRFGDSRRTLAAEQLQAYTLNSKTIAG